jgi:hypothetical protein
MGGVEVATTGGFLTLLFVFTLLVAPNEGFTEIDFA